MRTGLGHSLSGGAGQAAGDGVSATAPGAFGVADWSVATGAAAAEIVVVLAALPATGGSPISAVEYTLDGGTAWTALNAAIPGSYSLVMAAAGVSYGFALRARNAIGTGPVSASQNATSGTGVASAVLPAVASLAGIGDSITVGYNITADADKWLNRVSAVINSGALTNAGISGSVLQNSADASGNARSGNGRNRFVSALLGTNKREMAIVAYGFNDARYTGAPVTFNVAEYENDLHEVIAGLRIGGFPADRLLVVAPYYISDIGLSTGSSGFTGQTREGFEAFITAARAVAQAHGTLYFDAYAWMRDNGGASLIQSDRIHPTAAGHAVIAQGMLTQTTRLNGGAAPATVGATGVAGGIAVDWSTVAGASGYEVAVAAAGGFAFGAPVAVAGEAMTFSGLTAGSSQCARVRAIVDGLAGPWSYAAATTVLGEATVPGSFTASGWSVATGTAAGAVTLIVSTLPGSGGSALTALEYSLDGGNWVPLTGTGTGARSLILAAEGTSYSLRLRAVNALGAGPASATRTVVSGTAPTGLAATFGTGTITITAYGTVAPPGVSFGTGAITITA